MDIPDENEDEFTDVKVQKRKNNKGNDSFEEDNMDIDDNMDDTGDIDEYSTSYDSKRRAFNSVKTPNGSFNPDEKEGKSSFEPMVKAPRVT